MLSSFLSSAIPQLGEPSGYTLLRPRRLAFVNLYADDTLPTKPNPQPMALTRSLGELLLRDLNLPLIISYQKDGPAILKAVNL